MQFLCGLLLLASLCQLGNTEICSKHRTCPEYFDCCRRHCNNQLKDASCGQVGFGKIKGFCLCYSLKNSDFDLDSFREEALLAHNQYRADHGVSNLALDDELNESAQNHAHHLATLVRRLVHSTYPVGENLAHHTEIISGDEAVEWWYDEIEYYDYSRPGFSLPTSHFTQLIWKPVRKLGVGLYVDELANVAWVVCHYDVQGNIKGKFKQNVLPKIR